MAVVIIMSDEITINRDVLKAIGADTRVDILKALVARQKTQSEIASELKLSVPTVLEHLDHLAQAGLVEKLEEGRKWKYYRLTDTGRKIIGGSRINVMLILSATVFALVGVFYIL